MMNTSFIRLASISALVLTSLFSYIFLHQRSLEVPEREGLLKTELQEESRSAYTNAPDLLLIKKVFEAARRVLPISSGF